MSPATMSPADASTAELAATSFLEWARELLSGGGLSTILFCSLLAAGLLLYLLLRKSATVRRQRRELLELESRIHGDRIRRGYAVEALAPLLDEFPVEVGKPGTTTLFVGQPVDYLHFDDSEGITMIEIKSGSAGLSERQRLLQDHVERGRVRWITMRIDSET